MISHFLIVPEHANILIFAGYPCNEFINISVVQTIFLLSRATLSINMRDTEFRYLTFISKLYLKMKTIYWPIQHHRNDIELNL